LQLKDVTRRIDHGDDTIPSLPPLPLYRHVGQGFELPVIELPVFAPPRNPFCPPTPAAEATDFVNQFLPAATAGIPDLLPNPRFKNKMPGVAALFALLIFWLYYYFLPRASSLASDLSHSVGGRQFWMVLSGAVLAALGHQLTYFASVPMRNIVRWPSALACSCAIVMLYPAAATVAAWAAVLLVVMLIATLRFVTPGAALDHSIWKRYMSALSCSTLTTGPGASLVYGALGLKSRAL
jgi:hypothetical protein